MDLLKSVSLVTNLADSRWSRNDSGLVEKLSNFKLSLLFLLTTMSIGLIRSGVIDVILAWNLKSWPGDSIIQSDWRFCLPKPPTSTLLFRLWLIYNELYWQWSALKVAMPMRHLVDIPCTLRQYCIWTCTRGLGKMPHRHRSRSLSLSKVLRVPSLKISDERERKLNET